MCDVDISDRDVNSGVRKLLRHTLAVSCDNREQVVMVTIVEHSIDSFADVIDISL